MKRKKKLYSPEDWKPEPIQVIVDPYSLKKDQRVEVSIKLPDGSFVEMEVR